MVHAFGDILDHRAVELVQQREVGKRRGEVGQGFDTQRRVLADLLAHQDVGDRHQTVTHGGHAFGALDAKRAARVHGDLNVAIGGFGDLLCEGHRVLGVEVAFRPDDGHVPCCLCRDSRAQRDAQAGDGDADSIFH